MIYSFTEDNLSFDITGNEYGSMGYSCESYDEQGTPTGRSNFYDIPLSPGVKISAQKTDGGYTLAANGSNLSPNETLTANQNAGVTITCKDIAGGTVTGSGAYVRGDAVVLLATADDGYRFSGWYCDDVLIEVSRICEFTAQESVELRALFVPAQSMTINAWLPEAAASDYVDVADPMNILQSDSVIFAASYNEQGKMTDALSGVLGDGIVTFDRPLSNGWKLFFLDRNYNPLCEPVALSAA